MRARAVGLDVPQRCRLDEQRRLRFDTHAKQHRVRKLPPLGPDLPACFGFCEVLNVLGRKAGALAATISTDEIAADLQIGLTLAGQQFWFTAFSAIPVPEIQKQELDQEAKSSIEGKWCRQRCLIGEVGALTPVAWEARGIVSD